VKSFQIAVLEGDRDLDGICIPDRVAAFPAVPFQGIGRRRRVRGIPAATDFHCDTAAFLHFRIEEELLRFQGNGRIISITISTPAQGRFTISEIQPLEDRSGGEDRTGFKSCQELIAKGVPTRNPAYAGPSVLTHGCQRIPRLTQALRSLRSAPPTARPFRTLP